MLKGASLDAVAGLTSFLTTTGCKTVENPFVAKQKTGPVQPKKKRKMLTLAHFCLEELPAGANMNETHIERMS